MLSDQGDTHRSLPQGRQGGDQDGGRLKSIAEATEGGGGAEVQGRAGESGLHRPDSPGIQDPRGRGAGSRRQGEGTDSKSGDAFAGDLTPRPPGNCWPADHAAAASDGPATSNKGIGEVLGEGWLAQIRVHVQGTMNFNGDSRDIDRTTTVEIKDVGTTKGRSPEDAEEKLS